MKNPVKDNRRIFSQYAALRKAKNLCAKDASTITGVPQSTISKVERGTLEPSALSALHLSSVIGLRLDEVLNLSDGGDILIREHRPFIRIPHTLTQNTTLVKKADELNQPTLLEEYYWPGNLQSRLDLLLELTPLIAHLEEATVEYQQVPHRAEFVLASDTQGEIPARLKVGEAFHCLIEQQGLTRKKVAELSGMSRSFINDVENDHSEAMVSSLDLAARAVGVTIDELVWCCYPTKTRWVFFVQAYPWAYQCAEMVALVTAPDTLQAFTNASVSIRVRMMLAYKQWLSKEWEFHLQPTLSPQSFITVPAIFRVGTYF